MGSFSDLFSAFELIKEQQKKIEKQRETIEKQTKDISKLKEKNSKLWKENHTENYKCIKNEDINYKHAIKYINEPVLAAFLDMDYPSANLSHGRYAILTNTGSYLIFQIGTGVILSQPREINKRNHQLSDKTVDIIKEHLNSFNILDGNIVLGGWTATYNEGVKLYKILNSCKNIIELLESYN